MNINLKRIGEECKKYRCAHGFTQRDVAEELFYEPVTISAFEHGRINNAKILLWYINNGLDIKAVLAYDN